MKLAIIATTAALAISSNTTFAQQGPDAPPSPPPQAGQDRRLDPPTPPIDPPERTDEMTKSDWRMHPPVRERGARFRIETGRTTIDLRCPDGEPAKDCADLLLQVLDRLQGAPSDDRGRRGDDRERPRDW
ncbi:hypothetical protein [Neorhizobium sp. DT-125]|uniref:hypothetical protein n=1 Tax=Neorhizobium sp. DT-125 TaxID=3396163 RepID=UPI003F1D93B6